MYGAGDYLIGDLLKPTQEEAEALLAANKGSLERLKAYLTKDFGRTPSHLELATALKGRQTKQRFMKGLPALAQAREEVSLVAKGYRKAPRAPSALELANDHEDKWQQERHSKAWWYKSGPEGYIVGLDGRFVPVRSAHSALNFSLQGNGALVCKRWIVQSELDLIDAGYDHGKDFQFHAFVHDEIELSCRPEIAEHVRQIVIQAATKAGTFFNLNVPIAAEGKIGKNWKECH